MNDPTNDNVVNLHKPPPDPLDVLVESSNEDLNQVIVIGLYENGDVFLNSNILNKAEINYLLDLVKLDILTQ